MRSIAEPSLSSPFLDCVITHSLASVSELTVSAGVLGSTWFILSTTPLYGRTTMSPLNWLLGLRLPRACGPVQISMCSHSLG